MLDLLGYLEQEFAEKEPSALNSVTAFLAAARKKLNSGMISYLMVAGTQSRGPTVVLNDGTELPLYLPDEPPSSNDGFIQVIGHAVPPQISQQIRALQADFNQPGPRIVR